MKFTNTKAFTTRLLIALVLAAAGIAGQSGIAEAATCATCHAPVNQATPDIRPVEAAYRNITTGSIVGSHAKHMPVATTLASACTPCHGTQVTLTKHRNGMIELPSVGYTPKGASFPQSGAPVMGTCTTASCHDNGLGQGAASQVESPEWGSVNANCTICHPAVPITGSHPEHVLDENVACGSCHNGAVKDTTVSTQHHDGNVDVYKTNPGDLGYGTPDKAKGSAYTTCSNASCHKNPSVIVGGNAFTQLVTPTWGVYPPPARCTNCHAGRPTTGSHTAHFNAGFALCASCHKGAVESTTPPVEHIDGNIDVYNTTSNDMLYGANKAPGAAYSSCSAQSCHQNGRGVPVTSPIWGQTNNDCSACHATQPTTGTHTQHVVTVGITCGQCHKGALQGSVAPLQHLDGTVDVYAVTEGDLGFPVNKAIGSAFTSCSAATCHGAQSPVWGANTSNFQCTKCHGKGTLQAAYSSATNRQAAPGYGGTGHGLTQLPPTIVSNVATDLKVGAHDTHMRSLNNIGKPASCDDCHVVPAQVTGGEHKTGSSIPTFSKLAKNLETVASSGIPYTFSATPLNTNYIAGTATCSATYCHGSSITNGGGANTSPRWNETGYLVGGGNRVNDCAQCHGYPPTASLKYPHAGGDTTCSECHPHNGTRVSTDPLLGGDTHMNGSLEAAKHCNTCHDYDTRGANGSVWGKAEMQIESTGAHAVHINYLKSRMKITTMNANVDGFGSANYDGICGVCHTRNVANHTQTDRNAPRSITFGDISSVARKFGASDPVYNGVVGTSSATTQKTCSNVDCHYKTSPIWQSY